MTDIQIAQNANLLHINQIAKNLNLSEDDFDPYGKYKAKLNLNLYEKLKNNPDGNLILVTAITPTPAGEGKSTISVGLTQALNRLGHKSIAALREPSLGPVFGIKGGATGGGYSQVVPMDEINLHFTGDLHAITTAHNLIAATIDNHIKFGNLLNIDPNNITFKRVLDMNDRSLRDIVIGLGGSVNGVARQSSFCITVASEIMATLCLATSLKDLKNRISKIIFAYDKTNKPLVVSDLRITGAVTALLKDAFRPNLVQTLENTPVLIHGGPFANIAHGCNSLVATKIALKLSDYVVTEAGFAADLGAEKFLNIKCQKGDLKPKCVVLVVTTRALKYHGGTDEFKNEDLKALSFGFENFDKHIENLQKFNLPIVVAINRFIDDSEAEIELIKNHCKIKNISVANCQVWEKGGLGGEELAKFVVDEIKNFKGTLKPLYTPNFSISQKIEKIVKEIYGGDGVNFSPKAKKMLETITKNGFDELPVCISKTQKSLSDDPSLRNAPKGFIVHINELKIASGAGFIIAMAGDIIDMPGLPKNPSAEIVDIDEFGNISGLF